MAQRMSDDIARAARRRTRMVVATVAIVIVGIAVVVAGLVVAVGHRSDPVPDPAGGPVNAAGGMAGATVPSGSAGAVGPDAVSWSTVAGAKVPVSATAGPSDTNAGRSRGFAHTPLG